MLEDIRKVGPEDHWKQFEKAWTALLSYRYLGKTSPDLDAGVERESMPLRHDMRNSTGGIMAAPLCIASPEPYWRDDECVPAPVVMSYDIVDDARGVCRVDVLRDVIRLGKTMGFSRSRIVDADDHSRLISISSGMGTSLGDVPEGYQKVDNPVYELADSPDLPPLHVVFGAERGADGAWRLPELKPELASPHAALHLGPTNIVLEREAMDRAAELAGTDALQVESWQVMFVLPGVVGPFRAVGEATRSRSGRIVANTTLHDEGKGDRVIAVASAVFRPVADAIPE